MGELVMVLIAERAGSCWAGRERRGVNLALAVGMTQRLMRPPKNVQESLLVIIGRTERHSLT